MDNKKTDVSQPPLDAETKSKATQTPLLDEKVPTKEASATNKKSGANKKNSTQKKPAPESKQTTSPTPPAPENPNSNQASSRSPWGLIILFILLLLLTIATAAGGYYLYQQIVAQKALNADTQQQLKAAVAEPNQKIAHLAQQQTQLKTGIEQGFTQVKNTQAQLQKRVAVIAQRNPNHWRAEEAKYLVSLAGRKLWLEKDPLTSVSLLKEADDRIMMMNDPSLTPLRKALSQDIANVAAIKTTDISGTVLTLDGIIEHLNELPLNRPETHAADSQVDDTAMTDSIHDWRSNLAKSWKALVSDFVTIRKRTTDLAPLLMPEQQWYLVENIKNKLLQAQLALFRQDQLNYDSSLKIARKWIFEYFDLKDIQTQQALKALDAMSTLKIQAIDIKQFKSSTMLVQLATYGNLSTTEEAQ